MLSSPFSCLLFVVLFGLLPCHAIERAEHHRDRPAMARQWEVIDLCFKVSEIPDQPFDVKFSGNFEINGGAKVEVPGYYNGGREYVIRFTPPTPGNWSYLTRSDRKELDGLQGTLNAASASSERKGGIVIDPAAEREFRYQNGDVYYPIAFESDWLFALDAENDEGIPVTRTLVDRLASDGFNQIVMNVFAYDVKWEKDKNLVPEFEYGSPDVFPFGGNNTAPDHNTLNVGFFQRFDRVIDYLDRKGIAAHLMIYVWNKQVNWPESDSPADNRYFDYVVKRYQAFPNMVWDISKEALGYGHNDVHYISRRIDRLRRLDGHKRLITVHDYSYCRRFPDKLDFISVQLWSPELYSVMRKVCSDFPGKPILNIEHGGYEAGPYVVFEGSYTSPEVCLERAWQCVFAGTYPTHYWQGAAWNVIIPDIDSMKPEERPRFDYYRHMRAFIDKHGLGQLKAGDKKANSGFCLHNGDDLYIYYVPKENVSVGVRMPKEKKGQMMSGTWFDPFTGTYSDPETMEITQWPKFIKPPGDRFAILLVKTDPGPEKRAEGSVEGRVLRDYQAYIASGNKVSAWEGQRTALVLDGVEDPSAYDQQVMGEIVQILDRVFDAYDKVTGQSPKAGSRAFDGRATVEVSTKVGGGLAHHGRLGVAIGQGFFDKLYERFKGGERTLDQVFFYEIARNYWPSTFNPRIDYHTTKGPKDYGWWTVGFNNAMSIFMPSEVEGISDMYYFGRDRKTFSKGMEANLTAYLEGDYTWKQGWCINLVPWKERTSLNDLMTALLIRLHRENGGNAFISKLYREIPKLPKLKGRDDYQGARDQFYIASSLAAGKDLQETYKELRWELSDEARAGVARSLASETGKDR
ncbi:MAG: DUF5060 domain-containing protein [Verrucomicrobiota bacterium]